jgi:hypothetical protein
MKIKFKGIIQSWAVSIRSKSSASLGGVLVLVVVVVSAAAVVVVADILDTVHYQAISSQVLDAGDAFVFR